MNKSHFFSLSELKQPVNQWICIAFLGVWFFWMAVYYLAQKAEAISQNYIDATQAELRAK